MLNETLKMNKILETHYIRCAEAVAREKDWRGALAARAVAWHYFLTLSR